MERRYGARVEWRTFDLHPEYPPEGIPREVLRRRYPPGVADSVFDMIEEAGLPVDRTLEHVPNARKSLLLTELAHDQGRAEPFIEAGFAAYWAEGRDIGDDAVLLELARDAGLDEHEARAELAEQQRLDRVHHNTAEITQAGATGVPAWVIDKRLLVPGAQPHEVFDRVLEGLGHRPLDQEQDAS